jgi:hypothetical protein
LRQQCRVFPKSSSGKIRPYNRTFDGLQALTEALIAVFAGFEANPAS